MRDFPVYVIGDHLEVQYAPNFERHWTWTLQIGKMQTSDGVSGSNVKLQGPKKDDSATRLLLQFQVLNRNMGYQYSPSRGYIYPNTP